VIAGLTANIDESTAGRIRDRAFDRLEHAESPTSAAQALLENAKPAELGVLLEEIPGWLESRNQPTGFIPKVVASIRPDVAEAVIKRDKANQVNQIGHQTIKQIRRGLETGTPAAHLMPVSLVQKYDPER
jgi:hypothetical protein